MNRAFPASCAVAHIKGSEEYPNISGKIHFSQRKDFVLIEVMICNLPTTETGFFGFHIHEGENCSGDNFLNTGSHYNPGNTEHPKHAGDLPPLLFCNGGAYLAVRTNRFSVADIIGRTVVIHQMPDDFKSQPSGNTGTKIACGKIFGI